MVAFVVSVIVLALMVAGAGAYRDRCPADKEIGRAHV